MVKKAKPFKAPPKPEATPSTSQEPLDQGDGLTPRPDPVMSGQAMEELISTAQTPAESPTPDQTQTLKPTSKTIETLEKSTDPPPMEVMGSEKEASESDGGPYEPQFQRVSDLILTRWPTSRIAVILGSLARQGLISRLPDWDIENTSDVPGVILDRLKDKAYLRELWLTIVMMRNNRRGNHLGNPQVEVAMATGLAIMDYVSEICPRLTYQGVLDERQERVDDGPGD